MRTVCKRSILVNFGQRLQHQGQIKARISTTTATTATTAASVTQSQQWGKFNSHTLSPRTKTYSIQSPPDGLLITLNWNCKNVSHASDVDVDVNMTSSVECIVFAGKTTVHQVLTELQRKFQDELDTKNAPHVSIKAEGKHVGSNEDECETLMSSLSGSTLKFMVQYIDRDGNSKSIEFGTDHGESFTFPSGSAKQTLIRSYLYVGGGILTIGSIVGLMAKSILG